NGYTNCTDKLGSTNLKSGYETQFARYLVDILKFFRDSEHLDFDYISPVNEPQWEWNNGCNQEGNRAANADIIAVVKALYDELQQQQVATKISLAESGDIPSWHRNNSSMAAEYGKSYGNYLEELIANPEISGKIAKHFGGHSYWSDRLNGQLVEHRLAARPYFNQFFEQGWSYWVTEYCILDGPEGQGGNGRDLSITTALNIARVIHHDLTYLDAGAWHWWTAVSPEDYKDGLIYTNYKNNPASRSIIQSKTLWALGNFSRYIRPGAKRIKISGAASKNGLMGSAFLNHAGDEMIIVFVNVAEKASPISLTLSGLADKARLAGFTTYVTTNAPEDNLKEYAFVPVDSLYTIPARSVVTLVGRIIANTTVGKRENAQPHDLSLLKSYPNPFNHTTRIDVKLGQPTECQVNIYNISGQIVKTLFSGLRTADAQDIEWDATDYNGSLMSSGIYYCTLVSAQLRQSIKLLLVR
ncbi:MAG: T9SS C-terminal target domain-containing protein, partial [Calditrichaeota bacterium]